MTSPALPDNEFTHEPLPDPAGYVRLLEVLDDRYSNTIKVRCKLTTWPIDGAPPYHAISYTWGDPKSTTSILMNDQTLQVRTNCELALKQAYWYNRSQSYLYRKRRSRLYQENRREWYSESRYFWLDAICIDQTNLAEKSKQVAMMGDIYKRASRVLACIGDHADDSLFFFRTLYGFTHLVVRAKNIFKPNYDSEFQPERPSDGVSFRFRMLHRYSTTHRFVLALARIALRPYFTRMWILQELQHARSLTILCGQYVLPRDDAIYLFDGICEGLKSFDQQFNRYRLLQPPGFLHLNHKILRRLVNNGLPHPIWHGDWVSGLPRHCMAIVATLNQSHMGGENSTFDLLNNVVYRLQCEDPRDKIYGLISLIQWGDVTPLEPDYTHTDIKVAVDFVEAMMRLEHAKELSEPLWKYIAIVVKLFNFNVGSPGFAEALESRRGFAEDGGVESTEMAVPLQRSAVQLEQHGWPLCQEDVDKNVSKLQGLQQTPPWSCPGDSFYLSRWAKADDLVIEVELEELHDIWYKALDVGYRTSPSFKPLIVMRRDSIGERSSLIGYGFYTSRQGFDPPAFKQEAQVDVTIDLDTEDAILLFWRMKQLREMVEGAQHWAVDFLDIGVCKRQTPRSSYGILPSELPARKERVEKKRPSEYLISLELFALKNRNFILFDTQKRRGWWVDGQVAMLQLLRAYLKNVPQTEPFDFSKLKHFGTDQSSAYRFFENSGNLMTPIHRVYKDVGKTPGHSEQTDGQGFVETKTINQLCYELCNHLLAMSARPFPPDYENRSGWTHRLANCRNVVKGWNFDQIYRNNKAKVYAHEFKKDPGWLGLVKHLDLHAPFIFGTDLGDILQPHIAHCCPYFKTVPEGQDYLAVDPRVILKEINKGCPHDKKSVYTARIGHHFTWARGSVPISRDAHDQGDHLDSVDLKCFPVQAFWKNPSFEPWERQNLEKRLLKNGKGRSYSVQDVEDMLGVTDDEDEMVDWRAKKTMQAGMIVFGKKADKRKLRQLAEANLRHAHSLEAPQNVVATATTERPPEAISRHAPI